MRPRNSGKRTFRLQCAGEDLLVLSLPLETAVPSNLTPAELEVARAIVGGASNAQIARERQTSIRTVANQVAAILRKLGANSRAQVAGKLAQLDFSVAVPRPRRRRAASA